MAESHASAAQVKEKGVKLTFSGGKVTGSGENEFGEFSIKGTYTCSGDTGRLEARKKYLYADADSPIDPLLARYRELLGNDQQLAEANRTYLPFGASEPDRKIDYAFVGGPIEVLEARVMREHAAISDHLPLLARLRIRPPVTNDDPETEPVDGEP